MKIKQVLVVCALAVGMLAGATVGAAEGDKAPAQRPQGGGNRQEQIKERVDRIATELNLTEDQKGKIRTVLQREMEKTRELRGNQDLTQEQRREKMNAIRQEIQKEVKGILNEEQYKKWTEMRQQARERRGPGGQGGQPGGEGRRRGQQPPPDSK